MLEVWKLNVAHKLWTWVYIILYHIELQTPCLKYCRTTTSTWQHIIALYTKYLLTLSIKPKPTTAKIHFFFCFKHQIPSSTYTFLSLDESNVQWHVNRSYRTMRRERNDSIKQAVMSCLVYCKWTECIHGTVSHFGWKRWYDVIHSWSENLHPFLCEWVRLF